MGFFALPPAVQWSIAAIFGLLILATIIVRTLAAVRPEADWSELRQRVNSWWLMVVVFTTAMVLSRRISLAFFAFVSFMALKELLSLIPTRRRSARFVLGVSGDSCPILLGLCRVVRNVHHFRPGLHVLAVAVSNGANR